MHFHTVYGFPSRGVLWSEDWHETTAAAWAAVGEIAGENWRQDKARLMANKACGYPDRHLRTVELTYIRVSFHCIRGDLPAGTSFEIPALDSDKDAMIYGIIECGDTHLRKVG